MVRSQKDINKTLKQRKTNSKSHTTPTKKTLRSRQNNSKAQPFIFHPIKIIKVVLFHLGFPFFFAIYTVIQLVSTPKYLVQNLNDLNSKLNFKLPRPTTRKQKKATSHRVLKLNNYIKLTICFSFFCFVIYQFIFKDLPSPYALKDFKPDFSTQILDRNGQLLFKLYQDQNRTPLSLNQIPPQFTQALIATEDKEFYSHQGFSLKGSLRALYNNLTNKTEVQGGSTITQQLIKNTLLTKEKSLQRKLKEIILAIAIEQIYSKDDILTLYINQVGFGGPIYGLQEASQFYFSKNAADLTMAESTYLAGLPQAPTKYSPFGISPQKGKERQWQVLNSLKEINAISQEDQNNIYNENLNFSDPKITISSPHFVHYVTSLLDDYFGKDYVRKHGLQIHTTLDSGIQKQAQEAVKAEVDKIKRMNVSNGASLVTRPNTGEVLAMVGSKDYFDQINSGQVNLTITPRQPGSTVKPINYSLSFENGLLPTDTILDAPISIKSRYSEVYIPKNYDGKFHGTVTLRTALANSYNIPAVKLLVNNSPQQMAALAQDLGITTWTDPQRYGLSMTLGSLETKMTDLAVVYGTFANLGTRVPLRSILYITDTTGKVIDIPTCDAGLISKNPDDCLTQNVIRPSTAYLISSILSDRTARASAFGYNSILNIPNNEVAVKTGTSNNLRDNWTVGYTKDYLVATWVGNFDNSPMSSVTSGITGASPIWHKITQSLLEGKKHKFPTPSDIVAIKNCTNQTKVDYYPTQRAPKDPCIDTKKIDNELTTLNNQKAKEKKLSEVPQNL